MKNTFIAALAFLMIPAAVCWSKNKPALNENPLSDEQVEIYRDFLKTYSNEGKSEHFNLGNRTDPLDLTGEGIRRACLLGIELENEKEAATTFHRFDPKVNLSQKITLVDPGRQAALVRENDPNNTIFKAHKSVKEAVESAFATGLLTLSEIAFEKTHQFAVMSYSFVCGGLCGNGETIVFKKVGGKWERTERTCESWIS
jgi:hypothetical protein